MAGLVRDLSLEVSDACGRDRANASARAAAGMGREASRVCARPEGSRRARCFGPGVERARAERAVVPRRLRGPRAFEPDDTEIRRRGRLPARQLWRQEPALRYPRARDERRRERAVAVEA